MTRKWTPERQREYLKEWREKNKEHIKAQQSTPEYRARASAQKRRKLREDPEYRARLAARASDWRARNPDKMTAVRQRQKERRDGNKTEVRAEKVRAKYGLTAQDVAEMRVAQSDRCAICEVAFSETPNVDHCHSTGVIRGLLCSLCNIGIARFKDKPDIIRRAAEYVEQARPNAKRVPDETLTPRDPSLRGSCTACGEFGHKRTTCSVAAALRLRDE